MTGIGKQNSKLGKPSARYRVSLFNYQNDFLGEHYYRGPSFGYFSPEETLDLRGWVVPDTKEADQNLELQIIQDGTVIRREAVDFASSDDVKERYPELDHAANARYVLRLPLNFLESTEYVLRFCLIEGQKIKSRLWDLAFIKDEVLTKPIFVVGSPRAGTTAVGNAIRAAVGAKNYGEHHFLFLAKKLEDTVNSYFTSYHTRNDKGTFINKISPALVQLKISQQIKEVYCSWQPGEYFVDKTPGRNMLKSIPTIQNMWPEARYIFCKRRAYENVKSRLVKFPHLSAEQHAKQWVEVMQLWRQVRESLPNGSYIEVDQSDLKSEKNIALIGEMLEVSFMDIVDYLDNNSPQKSNYEDLEVTDFENTVLDVCKEELLAWGYSLKY